MQFRALRSNGAVDSYWRFHLGQEHHRAHDCRYLGEAIRRSD